MRLVALSVSLCHAIVSMHKATMSYDVTFSNFGRGWVYQSQLALIHPLKSIKCTTPNPLWFLKHWVLDFRGRLKQAPCF